MAGMFWKLNGGIPLFRICLFVSVTAIAHAQESQPATPADAARVLDLRVWKIGEAEPDPLLRTLAQASDTVTGDVAGLFAQQRQMFLTQGWTENPAAQVSSEYASATYSKNGYTVSLMISPQGMPGKVSVMIINHGNVDLSKLPKPPGATVLFANAQTGMYLTDLPPAAAAEEVRKQLQARGWSPYGDAQDVYWFKRNAVRLTASITAAPAQQGKTVISYSSELMSVDLPAPPRATRLQYADSNTQLSFDSPLSRNEVVEFYRESLTKLGWTPTLAQPVHEDLNDRWVFRNAAGDLLTMELQNFEGQQRVLARVESAAKVEKMLQAARAAEERRKGAAMPPAAGPRQKIVVPESATEVKRTAASVEFQLPQGSAQAALRQVQKSLETDGWKVGSAVNEKTSGTITLTKGEAQLNIVFVDPGFIPADVTIIASGIDLE